MDKVFNSLTGILLISSGLREGKPLP